MRFAPQLIVDDRSCPAIQAGAGEHVWMDIFEDLGGCVTIAIIGFIVLVLVVCVAVFVFGAALTDLTGG